MPPRGQTQDTHAPHGLASGQHADQVVVAEHLLGRVCERNGHGQRQALGDGHHNNRNGHEESVEDGLRSGFISVPFLVREEVPDLGEENHDGHGHAEQADLARHRVQLLLQRRGRLRNREARLDPPPAGLNSNSHYQHLEEAGSNLATGEEEGILVGAWVFWWVSASGCTPAHMMRNQVTISKSKNESLRRSGSGLAFSWFLLKSSGSPVSEDSFDFTSEPLTKMPSHGI
jgi:hypothetical protein